MADFFIDAWLRFTASDTLIAASLTIFVTVFLYIYPFLFGAKAKLRYGTDTDLILLTNRADTGPGVLRVRRLIISNFGRKAAHEVEIIFNWKPPHIEQYPHLALTEEIKGDGRYIVRAPLLNAKESINFTMATEVGELPHLIYLRAKDVASKPVEYRNLLWLPIHLRILIISAMFLGFFLMIYLIVIFFGWIFFGRYPGI